MKPHNEPHQRVWQIERFNWPMAIYLVASVIANVLLWAAIFGGI